MKQKMIPGVIAWSKGFTIIPFENVIAVDEDDVEGQLKVLLNIQSDKGICTVIPKEDASEFCAKYNLYLAAVEGLTVESRLVPDDSYPGQVKEVTR